MEFLLTPVVGYPDYEIARSGDVLTIDGEPFDFSSVPDGAVLPLGAVACDVFVGDIMRTDGVLRLPMVWPCVLPESGMIDLPAVTPFLIEGDGAVSLPSTTAEEAAE